MWINPAVAKFYNIVSNNAASINKTVKNITQNVSTPVFEKMTPADMNFLKMYAIGTRYRTGVTKPEVDELFAKDGIDFIKSAYNLFCEKFMLSDSLRPGLSTDYFDNAVMSYICPEHRIVINTNPDLIGNINNTQFFGLLRHEFQHCIQNLKILSHETVGEKAVDSYTKFIALRDKQIFDSILSVPVEDCIKSATDQQQLEQILSFKSLYENNPKEYEQFLEMNLSDYKQQLESLRQSVIRGWGVIKENSKESDLVKEYFKALAGDGYYNSDGSVNMGRYINTITEQEAFLAGDIAECDVRGICFFRKMKEDLAKIENNPELFKDIKKQIKENK